MHFIAASLIVALPSETSKHLFGGSWNQDSDTASVLEHRQKDIEGGRLEHQRSSTWNADSIQENSLIDENTHQNRFQKWRKDEEASEDDDDTSSRLKDLFYKHQTPKADESDVLANSEGGQFE